MKRENQCTRGKSERNGRRGSRAQLWRGSKQKAPREGQTLPQVWELQCECAHRLGTGGSTEKLIKLRFWKDILVSL